ncbi:glutaredoxin-C9-like [Prosopis cineraria]|uniref:glutaredoxin-C9-like n=1 Tax=Prosopis cineraria TaxID=364024 RepID=UPI00240F4E96|nr:glutaredoxin-C9-like [Prosopis cineraria]
MATDMQELQCLRTKRNSSSCSSAWKDLEGNDNISQYTSLKDILDQSPTRSFSFCLDANNEFDPSNITIKNELVRRAASVYLQSSAFLIPRNDNCLPAFCDKLKSRAASVYSWWRLSALNPIRACVVKYSPVPMDSARDVPDSSRDIVHHLASTNAVVVFSFTTCCMSTVVKRLLFSLGVGPTIVELDQHAAGPDIHALLYRLSDSHHPPVPAIFIGGNFLGGVQTLMASHINGTLVRLLKDAGALWL